MMKAFLLTALTAALSFAQGALPSNSSFFSTPTYPDVTKLGSGPGWLQFDARNEMKFVPKRGEEVRIPYKAIKNLQYERATQPPVQKAHKSKFPMPVRMNFAAKHQVTIRYDAEHGPETTTLWLDGSNYQSVLGTLTAKTGLNVERTGVNTW